MSFLQFTFRPTLIPAYAQAEFLSRFAQLVLDYETLIEPAPPSPPASSLPQPSSFVPVEGDEPEGAKPSPKRRGAERKMSDDSLTPKTLEQMTNQELRDRLADLKGLPADSPQRRNTPKFPKKLELVAEIRRLESLPASAPVPAPAPQPVVEAVVENASVAPSEASSKKPRKNPWAEYTPEQKATRLALQAEKRLARLVAKVMETTTSDGNTSA